mmetsp:Transcript_18867/g.45067  ORF Transcript_18867/g.45067 Transcript_18867/m.45067 type:complete len:236 (+) Transcript_18867:54-761(+)
MSSRLPPRASHAQSCSVALFTSKSNATAGSGGAFGKGAAGSTAYCCTCCLRVSSLPSGGPEPFQLILPLSAWGKPGRDSESLFPRRTDIASATASGRISISFFSDSASLLTLPSARKAARPMPSRKETSPLLPTELSSAAPSRAPSGCASSASSGSRSTSATGVALIMSTTSVPLTVADSRSQSFAATCLMTGSLSLTICFALAYASFWMSRMMPSNAVAMFCVTGSLSSPMTRL